MKVVFDCERMKYPHTGLFEYCRRLGNALLTEKLPGSELIYYIKKENRPFFNPEVDYIEQKSFDKIYFPTIKNINIWHTTFQASSYVPQNKKTKNLLTVHDLNFMHERKPSSKRTAYLKKHQANLEKADHIVAISEFTKQDILKYLNIKDKPITVIYNGCDAEEYPEYINQTYTASRPFLFAIGTVNPKKNFHVLPPLLKHNDFNLVIAGRADPNYQIKILEEARKYGVENRIIIAGPISDEDKYWYFKNCKAFLFPSLAEGFGIPVVEAMKFGKPVFLSDTTSLPEIGGKSAYYFENFDPEHMQQVFDAGIRHYEAHNPAEAIVKHALKFNWQDSAKAYWQVYQSLM